MEELDTGAEVLEVENNDEKLAGLTLFPAVDSIYSLLISYIDFEKEPRRADLSPGTQTELFKRYTEKMYRLDSLYRRSLCAYRTAGSLGSLSAIVERLEGRYSQHFLQPLAEIWDKRVYEAGTPLPPGVILQERFFKDVVKPALNRGEKLVVVISDDPSLHTRYIAADSGWKMILDRGLDIFQPFNRRDAFSLQNSVQESRRCRAFEITYLKNS